MCISNSDFQGWKIIDKLQSFTMDSVKVENPEAVNNVIWVVSENTYYLSNPPKFKLIEKRVSKQIEHLPSELRKSAKFKLIENRVSNK